MRAFKKLNREERMAELLKHINVILNRIHPDNLFYVEYIQINKENIKCFSDWDRERFALHTGEEYFVVKEGNETFSHNLYVVNVSCDSEMTALDELFRLLGRKF